MSTIIGLARDLIARFGEEAQAEAVSRAAQRRAVGDRAGSVIWTRVAECVIALTTERR
jgi:hypothetical protein